MVIVDVVDVVTCLILLLKHVFASVVQLSIVMFGILHNKICWITTHVFTLLAISFN